MDDSDETFIQHHGFVCYTGERVKKGESEWKSVVLEENCSFGDAHFPAVA
jgi:hypothetical protein